MDLSIALDPRLAEYDTRCPTCTFMIIADEHTIVKTEDGWVHVGCALDEGYEVIGHEKESPQYMLDKAQEALDANNYRGMYPYLHWLATWCRIAAVEQERQSVGTQQ